MKDAYKALARAIRVRDRYHDALQAVCLESEHPSTERYTRDMWRLYCRKVDVLCEVVPYGVRLELEQLNRNGDRYYDWGWVYDRLPLHRAHTVLKRSGANQRDLWTRKHPMPHND